MCPKLSFAQKYNAKNRANGVNGRRSERGSIIFLGHSPVCRTGIGTGMDYHRSFQSPPIISISCERQFIFETADEDLVIVPQD